MSEAEPAQPENTPAKTAWVRNCTQTTWLHIGDALLVFAPLQRR